MHVIPDSVRDPSQRYLGSTKDVLGRTEYFVNRDIDYVELFVENRKDSDLLDKLVGYDLKNFQPLLSELPVYQNQLSFLRKIPQVESLCPPN